MIMDLSKCKCQEAGLHGLTFPGTNDPIPCGQPGDKVVFHQNDGRNVYVMCAPCAYHNIKNRGGIELAPLGWCPECGSPDPDELHSGDCSYGKPVDDEGGEMEGSAFGDHLREDM